MGTVYWMTDGLIDVELAIEALSDERRLRANGKRSERARRESAAAGLLLEWALRERGFDPRCVRYSSAGKPFIEHDPFFFSISHSHGLAVCALSEFPVGVDCEKIRPVNLKIAERYFCESETDRLFSLPTGDRAKEFLRMWTDREALGKADGRGLSGVLGEFCDGDSEFDGKICFFERFSVDGWVVSVATLGGADRFEFKRVSPSCQTDGIVLI